MPLQLQIEIPGMEQSEQDLYKAYIKARKELNSFNSAHQKELIQLLAFKGAVTRTKDCIKKYLKAEEKNEVVFEGFIFALETKEINAKSASRTVQLNIIEPIIDENTDEYETTEEYEDEID